MITLRYGLTIGQGAPIRVNCNIGCNSTDEYDIEVDKINVLKTSGCLPDMMMDLSLVRNIKPLYIEARKILGVEVGTVLSYVPFSKYKGLEWNICKTYLEELCTNGISFVTIHFTASMELFQLAKLNRKVPITSRGGGLCLYDQKLNNHKNIFLEHINEIVEIVKRYDVAISLGSTFRPSNIFDALDEVHIRETKEQLKICKYLQDCGVKVLVENIGHISLNKLEKHALLLRQFNAPIMPLGPLPVDRAINMDHINNAVGFSFAAYWNCAHIVNSVTRLEHSSGKISADAILEGVRSAKICAHIANVSNGMELEEERDVDNKRESTKSCIIDDTLCSRCSNVCPLKLL